MKLESLVLCSLLISVCQSHLTFSQLLIYGKKEEVTGITTEKSSTFTFKSEHSSPFKKPQSKFTLQNETCKFTLENGAKLLQMRDNTIIFPPNKEFYNDNIIVTEYHNMEVNCQNEDLIMILHPWGANWDEKPNNLMGILMYLDDLDAEYFNNYISRAKPSTKDMSFIVGKVLDDSLVERLKAPKYLSSGSERNFPSRAASETPVYNALAAFEYYQSIMTRVLASRPDHHSDVYDSQYALSQNIASTTNRSGMLNSSFSNSAYFVPNASTVNGNTLNARRSGGNSSSTSSSLSNSNQSNNYQSMVMPMHSHQRPNNQSNLTRSLQNWRNNIQSPPTVSFFTPSSRLSSSSSNRNPNGYNRFNNLPRNGANSLSTIEEMLEQIDIEERNEEAARILNSLRKEEKEELDKIEAELNLN